MGGMIGRKYNLLPYSLQTTLFLLNCGGECGSYGKQKSAANVDMKVEDILAVYDLGSGLRTRKSWVDGGCMGDGGGEQRG
jgi:hypothetical protein